MIDPGCSFSSLMIEPSLIAKCLVSEDVKSALRSATALCCTSKMFQATINSDLIFQSFVELIDPYHPMFTLEKKSQEINEQETSFKHKFYDIRNIFLKKNETYAGTLFGEALVSDEGVEVISFLEDIISFRLKEGCLSQSIKIPKKMQIPRSDTLRNSPYVARSEKFLAFVLPSTSGIYIYEPSGEKCLKVIEVSGEICQLTIKDNLLCVVEQYRDCSSNLLVFNLSGYQIEGPLTIDLPQNETLMPPDYQICFGDEYLIYTQHLSVGNQIYALPLSCLSHLGDASPLPWIRGAATKSSRYILQNREHFIEITFKSCGILDISKITITDEGMLKTEISKKIVIMNDESSFLIAVCLQNDRLFLAYENFTNKGNIYSYDFISGKVNKLFSSFHISPHFPFKPQFLSTVTTIYYLMRDRVPHISGTNKSTDVVHLTTLTFGKI